MLDRERTLRCDLYAMRLFKEKTGISLLKGELRDNVAEDNVPELVWSFIVHEDKDLTIDDVAKMIHPGNLVDILSQVFGLIVDSLPAAEEEAEGGDDPLAETT